MRKIILFILLISFILGSNIVAQKKSGKIIISEKHPINLNNKYELNASNIVPNSEKIILRGRSLNHNNYSINYRTKIFSLSDSLKYSVFDTLYIIYTSVKVPLKKEYYKRKLEVRYDDKLRDSISIIKNELVPLTSETIFGKGIKRSGSISRGFSIGTNQDMQLNSGMRLQFSGKLSNDLEIVAALTDRNVPIQPEGTTERLEELDQVFIKVKHPNAAATFGDFQMTSNVGEFGKITRKMQGLEGEIFSGKTKGKGIIAGSKGKFNTNRFLGQDGNQGPYKLSGVNNEQLIIVIAGTERVYIDGEELKRGENNDYTIDYSLAEITFTVNKLITSASRIVVDFEYSDRKFERNLYGVNAASSFFNNKFKISVSAFNENDDKDNPIDITLSASDIEILKRAGNDRNKAVKSGITIGKTDSSGKIIGTYSKIDTLINGEAYSYYLYVPGDDSAKYNVSFSFVGNGNGDYSRISVGYYKFVGIGKGDYLPVVFIPMPQKKQMGNILLEAKPWKNFTISAEFAGSVFDRNTFSSIDDDRNFGHAHNFLVELGKSKIDFAGLSLGEIGFSYRERYLQDRFSSLDRFNTVEFGRDYNIVNIKKNNETLREAHLFFAPIKELQTKFNYGFLKRGNFFNSNRLFGNLFYKKGKGFQLTYDYDYVTTNDKLFSSNWLKQSGRASYLFNKIIPGIEFLYDNRKEWNTSKDSLNSNSRKFQQVGAFITLSDLAGLNLTARYSLREETFPINGIMEKESVANQAGFAMAYSGVREVNTTLDVTVRNKKYTEKFSAKGLLDNNSVLIRSQNRFNFWKNFIAGDFYYEASTQSTARLEKVFVRVQYGEGNYKYLGDLNNNGIADENEFVPDVYEGDYIVVYLPTTELFPVINLKTGTRWKVEFKRILKSKKSLLTTIFSPVSFETVLRLDEYSKEKNISSVLLLKPNVLMNDSTTIHGANSFQQDFFLFKNKPDLSFRFRYLENNKFNQYNTGNEFGNYIERSLRIRFRMVREIRNQTDYVHKTDNLTSDANSARERLITADELTSDFSYRPIQNIEVGFKFGAGKSVDNLPVKPTKISSNSQLIRFTYSFTNKGRLRIEFERNEISDNETTNIIPYEMLHGKVVGINYFWRVNFDYRLAENLQVTLNYLGRKQGANKIVHNMRSEVRAYF